jgi:WD40 repeat protein
MFDQTLPDSKAADGNKSSQAYIAFISIIVLLGIGLYFGIEYVASLDDPLYNLPVVGSVESLVFSPDGDYMATGLQYGTVQLWDMTSGTELATLERPQPAARYQSSDSTIYLWNVSNGTLLEAIEHSNARGYATAAFSADGTRLITTLHAAPSRNNATYLRDAVDGRLLYTASHDQVLGVARQPDGMLLAARDLPPGATLGVWRIAD